MVEDDRSVQKTLKRLLEAEGFAVEGHLNGRAGLASFHAEAPSFRNHYLRTRGRIHRRSPGGNAQRHALEQCVVPGTIGDRRRTETRKQAWVQ